MRYKRAYTIAVHILTVILLSGFTSCQKFDDIYGRLDKLETTVIDIQSAVKSLQDAYSQGRIIKSVTPLTDTEAGGWLIVFSNDSEIRVVNGTDGKDGADGATPFLKINQDGCWTVSYDNGATFVALLDGDGNRISAVGKDGKDGDDGAEGLSIRLSINEGGYYVVQTYKESDPASVISEIATPYTANASRIITSLEQDDVTHAITMTLADGKTFTFNVHFVSPTGIAMLAVNPIYLTSGTQASIEFRVNPSNAQFNLSGDNRQIELDKVGTVQVKSNSSYVTAPTNYRLASVEQVYNEDTGGMKVGQYRAIIEDTKISAEYDEMAALVLNVNDANGNPVQISSSAFRIIGNNYESLPHTGLPVVIINTPDSTPIASKEDWTTGATMTILNADMTFDYQGTLGIKGRGNSTWSYPKKPYTLKLDKKSKVLGMPKQKRWCLLANWMDRTLMRNAVSFEIARKCPGLAWTPSGKYVEVVLNGSHIGNYYLCEQIKVDENRVNIAEIDNTVTEGEGITGGFIMELDKYYDEVNKFKSTIKKLPWMFKDPDDVNSAQLTYMQNYVNAMEERLYDDAKFASRDFADRMDLESFVDWWLVNELAMNDEGNQPKSCYMNKDKNGVIKAGPVWDFDYGTYLPKSTSKFIVNKALYYGRLFEDATFKALVKSKWAAQKSGFEEVYDFIDELAAVLAASDVINHSQWPITTTVNGDESMTFNEAVTRLKNAYQAKLEWMDTQICAK